MFQIGTNWQLWDLSKDFDEAISGIGLRGYKREEPILLPAEFSRLRPLSVDNIANIYCPTRRDLFLLKKRRLQGSPTWGRIAGPLIEDFCMGLIDEYQNLFDGSSKESYDSIKNLVEDYSNRFITNKQEALNKLKRHSTAPAEDVANFVLVL